MTINIALGWWVIPAAVTAIALLIAAWRSDRSYSHGLGAVGQAMANAFIFLIAIVISLIAWLIWSLAA